jgi:hypothetical protein
VARVNFQRDSSASDKEEQVSRLPFVTKIIPLLIMDVLCTSDEDLKILVVQVSNKRMLSQNFIEVFF